MTGSIRRTAALTTALLALAGASEASASNSASGGCNNNDTGGETFSAEEERAFNRTSLGDVIPSNFFSNGITRAWSRGATGAGVTVVSIDTGVYGTQHQLWDPGFDPAEPPGTPEIDRKVDHVDVGAGVGDACNHGTRSAGTATAPLDGVSTVGAAYQSNLRVAKIGDDVVLDGETASRMSAALRATIVGRARLMPGGQGPAGTERIVVAMAVGDLPIWGITGAYAELQRTIEDLHRNYDVLFVGAGGSTICSVDDQIAFPARLPQVLAVTAAKDEHTVHRTACGGPDIDLAVHIPDSCPDELPGAFTSPCMSVPAPGRRPQDLVQFSASSDATAVMSGLAAAVWSQHTGDPAWTRDRLRERLIQSGSLYPVNDPMLGKGIVDGWKAAGAFAGLSIDTPDTLQPGQTFTARAVTRGDGPFTYRWHTGATTSSIQRVAGAAGTKQTLSVTVTDTRDNVAKTVSKTVGPPPPPPEEGTICDRYPWKCGG